MKILIVDDNPKIRHLIKSMLETQVSQIDNIFECDNGMEALDIFKKTLPDWVLMDIAMEPLNGFITSESIFKSYPEAKIAFVTQYDETTYREEARKIGVRAYVLKEDLLDIPGLIRNIL